MGSMQNTFSVFETLKKSGINPKRNTLYSVESLLHILLKIEESQEHVTVSMLARALNIVPATCAVIVNSYVELGFITVDETYNVRRGKALVITQSGSLLLKNLKELN